VLAPETIPGPVQLKETPDVEEDPFNETDVVVQLSV
jgi:hypothetical protein